MPSWHVYKIKAGRVHMYVLYCTVRTYRPGEVACRKGEAGGGREDELLAFNNTGRACNGQGPSCLNPSN